MVRLKLGLAQHRARRRSHSRLSCRLRLALHSWTRGPVGRLGWPRRRLVGRGSVKSLVKSSECNGPPPLSLGAGTSRGVAVNPLVVSGGIALGEGRANSHGHQHQEDLVSDRSHKGLHGAGEELGKRKRLARIAALGGGLRRLKIGEDGLVESEVGPAGKETKDSEPQGGPRKNRSKRQKKDDADIDQRESRHSEG